MISPKPASAHSGSARSQEMSASLLRSTPSLDAEERPPKIMVTLPTSNPPPQATVPPTAGLPIGSRRDGAPTIPAAAPGLPIAARQVSNSNGNSTTTRPTCSLPGAAVGRERVANYVVATITTPVRKGRRLHSRKRTITSGDGSSIAVPRWAQQRGSPGGLGTSSSSIPKWAQHLSPSAGVCDPSPVDSVASHVSSINSSLLHNTWELESNCSFGFMPGVFAQAWHQKLSDEYNMITCIGEGRNGAVFIVKHKQTEREYACKMLRKVDHDRDVLLKEISTLHSLDHPNVVRLEGVVEDKDTIALLMELCHGGDLFDKIYSDRRLDEPLAKCLAHQMLSALAYCHASGVAHRDVKPDNFLLEHTDDEDASPTLKLADFGIATSIRPEHIAQSHHAQDSRRDTPWPSACDSNALGSLPYMAPEVLMHSWRSLELASEGSPKLLAAADLWSCGVSLYVMLAGHLPFPGETEEEILYHIRQPLDFDGPGWEGSSSEARDLIAKLLNPCPEERLTAQEALAHEWFLEEHPSPCLLTEGAALSPLTKSPLSEFAGGFLRRLRAFRGMPKLRRIAITAMARRLEDNHETRKLAQAAWSVFAEGIDRLTLEHLVEVLDTALGAMSEPPSTTAGAAEAFRARGGPLTGQGDSNSAGGASAVSAASAGSSFAGMAAVGGSASVPVCPNNNNNNNANNNGSCCGAPPPGYPNGCAATTTTACANSSCNNTSASANCGTAVGEATVPGAVQASVSAPVAPEKVGRRLAPPRPPPPIALPSTPIASGNGAHLGEKGFFVPGAVATTPSPAGGWGTATASPSGAGYYLASPGSAPGRLQGETRSGFHLRGRFRLLVKSLSGLAEETPTPTPQGSSTTPSSCLLGFPSPLGTCATRSCFSCCSEFVSRTELRYLVSALDGQKDGFVDYSLLLACLISPEVYCEERRIAEVFSLFDYQKRGFVGPKDFCKTLTANSSAMSGRRRWRSRDSLRQIAEMLVEFDLDGDGQLDFSEFRTMVRGISN